MAISTGLGFSKNQCECPVHILRSPWLMLGNADVKALPLELRRQEIWDKGDQADKRDLY